METTTKQNVKDGEEVEIALLKPDKKAVEKAFGIAKGKLNLKESIRNTYVWVELVRRLT